MRIKLEKTLLDLIQYKTVSGKNNQSEVLKLFRYVTKRIPSTYISKTVMSNGFHSLVIKSKKEEKKKRNVVLTAHIDVVSAREYQFNPIMKSGKIYGRGASDMKFAVPIFLKIISDIKECNFNLRIILTSDEEIGGVNGVKHLSDKGFFENSTVIILPDGGKDFCIVVAQKGIPHLKITSNGRSGHGSRPWEGDNAIMKLLDGVNKLKKDFNKYSKNTWVNTASVGSIAGGVSTNSIPDFATLNLDIRYTEKFTRMQVMNKIANAFPDCTVEILAEGLPFKLEKGNIKVNKLKKAIKAHTKKDSKWEYDHGGSDARFLTSIAPVLIFKPQAGGQHTENEWVDIKSLETYYEVLKDFLLSLEK